LWDSEAEVLVQLARFLFDCRGVTTLEAALIAAIIAVACTDVLVSRGPGMSGEISQVSGR
jgi:Flp pilus assembly pilin Flp